MAREKERQSGSRLGWDFSKSKPGVQQLEDVLAALLPVWVVWNSR